MSEYQYYDFVAVDRPLTPEEMAHLRTLSTRATITPTRFTNFYTWGDFKGDPLAMVKQYFDAFVYVANWSTHQLMLRLPRRVLSRDVAHAYRAEERLQAQFARDHVILTFRSEDEEPEFDEDDGEGWMSALIPLRAELAGGDRRALYLGWLAGVQAEELDEDTPEPPVPAGLRTLSATQQAFASFLRVQPDLLAVAAEASPPLSPASSRQLIRSWVRSLADPEKTDLLVQLIADASPQQLQADLLQRTTRSRETNSAASSEPGGGRRTVGQLLGAAARQTQARERAAAERAERERQRLERARAAARAAYLDRVAGRADELWEQVDALAATKRPKDYDRAVELIRDVRDLAVRQGQMESFVESLEQVVARHAKKPSLLQRLDASGFLLQPAHASSNSPRN